MVDCGNFCHWSHVIEVTQGVIEVTEVIKVTQDVIEVIEVIEVTEVIKVTEVMWLKSHKVSLKSHKYFLPATSCDLGWLA